MQLSASLRIRPRRRAVALAAPSAAATTGPRLPRMLADPGCVIHIKTSRRRHVARGGVPAPSSAVSPHAARTPSIPGDLEEISCESFPTGDWR